MTEPRYANDFEALEAELGTTYRAQHADDADDAGVPAPARRASWSKVVEKANARFDQAHPAAAVQRSDEQKRGAAAAADTDKPKSSTWGRVVARQNQRVGK